MSLFQESVLKSYLQRQDNSEVVKAYKKYVKYFHNPTIQQNIKDSKEEQFQEGFLRELFVNIFDYVLNPNPDFNLTTEYKNQKGAKKADGAILKEGNALAVIELKGTKTKDLESIRQQAFDYKTNQTGCVYVITSNFEKLRFYINNAVDFEEFNLFTLNQERFALMYLCLHKENLLNNLALKINNDSVVEEEKITKKFYADYSLFKRELYRDLVKQNLKNEVFREELSKEDNEQANKNIKLTLFKKSQKLIDRFLFIFFAEDRGLLPPNSTLKVLEQWDKLKELDEIVPLYKRYIKYFNYLDTGRKGTDKVSEIFAYNGGLFQPDPILDSLNISDELLYKHTSTLANYDFESQVDVNILGHIFENSLNEIESVNAEIEGTEFDKQKTKRKKDGVFYTPKYITKYIVDNTVGKLCTEKKAELGINEEDYFKSRKGRPVKTLKALQEKLETYRNWMLTLTILDPACGSGAFLNQALDFLIKEHRYIDELQASLLGGSIVFQNIESTILENNIYGVDLNEESVEIAKLSLWLRTAQPRRQLNVLSNNIKCGNSLIDDKKVAGDKAFNWQEEFPEVFANGGFDVVIGNPPYGAFINNKEIYYKKFGFKKKTDTYQMFTVLANELICINGIIGLIIPNSWMTRKAGEEFRAKLYKFRFEIVLDFLLQVFEDANIDTCIIIFGREIPNNHIVNASKVSFPHQINEDIDLHEIKFENWINVDKFNCELTETVFRLFGKLNTSTEKLGNLTIITGGYKPYQVGYGKSIEGDFPQTHNDVKNHVYHSKKQIDNSYYPDIKGGNIDRFFIKRNTQWVKWGDWLMSPKKFSDFINPKIVVREVTGKKINACYDDIGYFTNDTTHMVRGANPNDLIYYLAIINSTLMGWYFRVNFGESNDLFPKIKVNELKEFPIKVTSIKSKQLLIEKANGILKLYKMFQSISINFQKYLQSQFPVENLPKKLQNWHELEFSEFIKELNKAIKKAGGQKLTKSDEMEWMEVFEVKKAEAQALKAEIDKTDRQIDQMVYELYGLSEEEIRIVEDSVK